LIWSPVRTGKIVWPIPNKGLKKRFHRMAVLTLIIWGSADHLITPACAHEFAQRIDGARVELIERAGQLPHIERPNQVSRVVRDFFDG
jgi:pimeloyl-ACP methyl ester carboxylesterase